MPIVSDQRESIMSESPAMQQQPGRQATMQPQPESIRAGYIGSQKLQGKVAIITGGDSGIGRAIALHYAREGADVGILYLEEHEDAATTLEAIRGEGVRGMGIAGDCGDKAFCTTAVTAIIDALGAVDILVNNAAEQHVQHELGDISQEQLQATFRTNIFGYFFMAQAALPHMKEGGTIINTGSVTSFKDNSKLMDYSATKGAIQAFTLSLASELADRKIRVNEVAPGPIWTPLIPATFSADEVEKFGKNTLMKRAGQPAEVAPAYVFLASDDASYITGQIIHVNGGGYFGI